MLLCSPNSTQTIVEPQRMNKSRFYKKGTKCASRNLQCVSREEIGELSGLGGVDGGVWGRGSATEGASAVEGHVGGAPRTSTGVFEHTFFPCQYPRERDARNIFFAKN